MKKFVILLVTLTLLFGICNNSYAQNLRREREKEAKKKVKRLTEEGWNICGTLLTPIEVIEKHYQYLDENVESYTILGDANASCNDIDNEKLLISACNEYAVFSSIIIRDSMTVGMKSLITEDEMFELQDLYSDYADNVATIIKSEIKASFSISRKINSGYYEFKTYYFLDKDAANRASIKAFENAAKESAVAKKHLAEISKIIQGINYFYTSHY